MPSDSDADFRTAVHRLYSDARELLLSKHDDYGPRNIADAPGGALNGLRVRMHDKLARINHLESGNLAAKHESLRDSYMDLANYALIGVMVLDGDWPGA